MAAFRNARDIALQATSPRTETVVLPSNFVYNGDVSGNVSGTVNFVGAGTVSTGAGHGNSIFGGTGSIGSNTTLDGLIASLVAVGADRGNDIFNGFGSIGSGTTIGGLVQTALQNSQISLSSGGTLLNAGGGSITALPYSNTTGGPPINATANFFSTSGGNPSGGSDGDAHWNSSSSTMWFKTGGVWRVGGTINANEITVGTLAAARIASNSITTDKINVGGSLSNLETNLGTVTSGTLTSSVSMSVNGSAVFNGSSNQGFGAAAVNANTSLNSTNGVIGRASFGSGVLGIASSGIGVLGQATSGGTGGQFSGSGGSNALEVFGSMLFQGSITMSTQTISNLSVGFATSAGSASTATNATNADSASFATSAGSAASATNSSQLGGIGSSFYARQLVTNSGTATASSSGFVLTSTVTGVRTRATGGRNVVIESFSDENAKVDIMPEELGLDFVLDLNPITYKVDPLKLPDDIDIMSIPENTDITYHGFGARETKEKLETKQRLKTNDSLGRTLSDGIESTCTISMIGPMVNAIKELNSMVENLQAEINKLKLKSNPNINLT